MKFNDLEVVLGDGSTTKTVNALEIAPTWERFGELIEDIGGNLSENNISYRVAIKLTIMSYDTSGNDISDWLFTSFFPSESKTVKLEVTNTAINVVLRDDKISTIYPGGSSRLGKYVFTVVQKTTGDIPPPIPPGGE
jgi:hypothetical protein